MATFSEETYDTEKFAKFVTNFKDKIMLKFCSGAVSEFAELKLADVSW